MKKILLVAVGIALLNACTRPAVLIEDAWIRTPLPGMNMTAAYFVIRNPTDSTVTVVGASSDAYDDVTIHESRVVNGVSEMIRMRSLSVAAGDTVRFKPGGLHIMMSEPVRQLAAGEQARLMIELSDGNKLSTTAMVSDQAPQ
ncbi:MAG: copper chaperone PCu(A)C [Gammaproteobacteria bacterium]|nr:copper chaperone PCu(A)C [Gammaproteobacteria bacterium]